MGLTEPFRILNQAGEVIVDVEPRIHENMLLGMYRIMLLSRILDEWLVRLQRAGKVVIHAPVKGQEATMVGTAYSLEKEDWIFPTYRDFPVYLVRGVPVESILNRWCANAHDILRGRDLAVFGDRRYRIVPAPVPVATHIPLSVGFAYAAKLRGERIVVMTYFGDGASSKGDFHEGLNFAGVFKTPNVFVCQNNQYAISTPITRQTAAESIAVKSKAYGIKGERVDGNDILAVYVKTSEAVKLARERHEPTLLEALTYRLGAHSTADDPSRYRSEDEVKKWEKLDPIPRFRSYLINRGLWSLGDDKQLREELESFVKEKVEALDTTPPEPETILEDVYHITPWHIEEEKEELRP